MWKFDAFSLMRDFPNSKTTHTVQPGGVLGAAIVIRYNQRGVIESAIHQHWLDMSRSYSGNELGEKLHSATVTF